ncbi:MAG: cupin domain-containing protein [Neomegalonema sp.]|nr:cupin domain-containing protein [Neomegalonema sp.]
MADAKAVNLAEKLTRFSEHWSPKIVADYNGDEVMVVKLQGAFPFHHHDDTDDFFLVLKGRIRIELKDDAGVISGVELGEGELFVVPKGVVHRPVADEEAHVLLIEPKGEPNSGDPDTAAVKVRI